MSNNPLNIGIDIGSTTVKISIYDKGIPIFERYERHKFDVETTLNNFINDAIPIIKDRFITVYFFQLHLFIVYIYFYTLLFGFQFRFVLQDLLVCKLLKHYLFLLFKRWLPAL